jgi:hypothetical protein
MGAPNRIETGAGGSLYRPITTPSSHCSAASCELPLGMTMSLP